MNILILNDTSKYHSGSNQVIRFLSNFYKNHNVTLVKKAYDSHLSGIDMLIINGEGTMHDDAKKARSMLLLAKYAKTELNIKTMLVNSVWQRNSSELSKLLTYFDFIGVREILSKNEIQNCINIHINVHLDLSFYNDVPYEEFEKTNILAGNYYHDGKGSKLISNVGEDSYIDIFNEDWNVIVNKLRHAKILVTGRHHEMYAACKARCPFVVLEGNTHKNLGLFKTFNVDIPVLSQNASLTEIKNAINRINIIEFDKLFDQMHNQPEPKFIE